MNRCISIVKPQCPKDFILSIELCVKITYSDRGDDFDRCPNEFILKDGMCVNKIYRVPFCAVGYSLIGNECFEDAGDKCPYEFVLENGMCVKYPDK